MFSHRLHKGKRKKTNGSQIYLQITLTCPSFWHHVEEEEEQKGKEEEGEEDEEEEEEEEE